MDTALNSITNPYSSLYKRDPNNLYSRGTDKKDRTLKTLMAESEFNSDLALLDYQNEYNSDFEKAKRMREAGLNADLLGTSDSANSAGLSGLTGSADVSAESPLSVANTISDSLQSVFNSALQSYEQFQNIRSNSLDNDLKALNLEAQMRQNASDLSDIIHSAGSDISDDFQSKYFRPVKLSKKLQNRYSLYFDQIDGSINKKTKRNQDTYNNLQSNYNLSLQSSQPFFRESNDDMNGVLKAWQSYCEDVMKNEKLYLSSKYKHDKSYYDGVDVNSEFASFNSQNRFNNDYYGNLNGKSLASFDSSNNYYNNRQNKFAFDASELEHRNTLAQQKFYDSISKFGGSDAANFGYLLLSSIPNGLNAIGSAILGGAKLKNLNASTAYYNRR